MPRSSRHKSSKHSSRDARECSDSEKDWSLKERKSKVERESDNARAPKESGAGEKRKLAESSKENNKNSFGSGNGEHGEESSSSKRRKERGVEGVNDRWNGGGEDQNRGEGTKKSSKEREREREREKVSESRSQRRDEGVEKSSGKSEGKHRESSSRKEGREGERERERVRDRKGKEGKDEKMVADGDEPRAAKETFEKTELNTYDLLQIAESENQPDRRIRKKRDGSGDGDKHQNDVGDMNDKQLSSREGVAKQKEDRCRDRYCEEADRESRHRDDKQRDERSARDHIGSRSGEKHTRDDKDVSEIRQKKSKPQDSDRNRECDHDYDLTRAKDRDRDCNRDRDLNKDQDCEHECDHDHNCDRNWDRNREREHDGDRYKERDRDRDRDSDLNTDFDVVYADDRSGRYKDSRGRKRSSNDRDDYNDAKSKGMKVAYPEMERKTLSSSRVDPDADRGRSQSRPTHMENNVSSRRRGSPDTSSHEAAEDYRHFRQEESKYRDVVIEQRSKVNSSRESADFPVSSERVSKYTSTEKIVKMDDGHVGELPLERSSSSKASSMGLMDRSPSSSLERRYANRNSARRSLDIEESGRRSSGPVSARDFPPTEDGLNRDLSMDKPLVDDSTSGDSSFYNRSNLSNSSFIPPPPSFRGGVGSPLFLGPLEEDGRGSTGARYRRTGDPNLGRGQGNVWRGAPNWSSQLPNGYMPFQHGPAHGAFQGMMPHFPSPLFGVRPSMEINHSGIPYHISDAERFSSHLRPLGWQSMMDGSGSSRLCEWDGNNRVYRDETSIYGGPDWSQNRHPMNSQGWESTSDIWKGHNGALNVDLPSTSLKEDFPVHVPGNDVLAGQRLQKENHNGVQLETVETKPAVTYFTKDSSKSSLKTSHERTTDPPIMSTDDNIGHFCCAYLSNLDISTELADPELYGQLMGLLSMQQVATVEEDYAMLVNLKDGAKALPKSSSILLNPPLSPVTSVSVFQRAMDIYKKQRVGLGDSPIVSAGTIDAISTSAMESIPVDVDKLEDPILSCVKSVVDVRTLNSDQKRGEASPSAATQGKSEEIVSTFSVEVQVPNMPDLELADRCLDLDTPGKEKSVQIFSGNKRDGMSSDLVKLENVQEDFDPSPNNVPKDATFLSSEGHNLNETDKNYGNNSQQCTEEKQGFGEAMCGPLFFSVPGSVESESVILSRIHHSPESTH